jgi:uncharacterized membrane protein YdfJ with MMPL/SSD domain
MTAFLFRLLATGAYRRAVSGLRLINSLGFSLLLFLMLVSLFSIYQIVMIIFGLAQNYHLHLVLRKPRRRRCSMTADILLSGPHIFSYFFLVKQG